MHIHTGSSALSASSISAVTDAATPATNTYTFIFQTSSVCFPTEPSVPQPADAPQCSPLTVNGYEVDLATYATTTYSFLNILNYQQTLQANLCAPVSTCDGAMAGFLALSKADGSPCGTVFTRMVVAPQVVGSSIVATYADDTGSVFAQVAIVGCEPSSDVLEYQMLTDQNGTTTYYFPLMSPYTCQANTPAAQCAPLNIDGKTVDLAALPDVVLDNVQLEFRGGYSTCDLQINLCGANASIAASGGPTCPSLSPASLTSAPRQVGNGLLLTYSSMFSNSNHSSPMVWTVYLLCGTPPLGSPSFNMFASGMMLILESSAACFPSPPVPTQAPPAASCPPLSIGNSTIDISTIGTVVLPGANMQVNLCSAVSSCGGAFNSFVASTASRASGCASFGVFTQMVMAPQVVDDAVVVSYSDAGGVNFATVVLQCGNTSLSAPNGASENTTNAQGGNNYVFMLQSSAACFPVPVPPLPLPTPSPPTAAPTPPPSSVSPAPDAPSSSHTVSAGAIAGIAIGACAGLFIAATLILNWRHNQMHVCVKFWTIVPRMCCPVQPPVATEAPLMADAPIQADNLMKDV
jgi:hypothetical protein